MKKDSFEYNVNEVDMILEKLESGELTLEDSIKEYEKAMKLLKKSSDILNKAKGKIIKVSSENNNVILEEEKNA
ncbi:exodeoxyribonuclease VII small subunit [uncultured Cetobacterium sp.]|uniref:exodeoxyribonuclease VII small subunit n=1 Tax=uncultured Cetobacterium sp. TaxID=527638 RepID=UPI0026021654|nr:exodeoxyribonuclease VII small subunit [uncultured Cetobacterium sp.]